jgi:hypothetical protein
MGIGFVLLCWGFGGIVLTAIFTVIAFKEAPYRCFGIEDPERKQSLATELKLFPMGCFAWIVVVFIIQAAVNHNLLHRDIGLGDGFDCPLPNGYALTGIDETDRMRLYNPVTLPGAGYGASNDNRADVANNVISMQLAGQYMAGATATDPFRQHWAGSDSLQADSYFILDTRAGTQKRYKSVQELQAAAAKLGFKLELKPMNDVYRQNRFTIFDQIVLLLQFGLPFLYRYGLSRRVAKSRNPKIPLL